jgi:hypothetical protein
MRISSEPTASTPGSCLLECRGLLDQFLHFEIDGESLSDADVLNIMHGSPSRASTP